MEYKRDKKDCSNFVILHADIELPTVSLEWTQTLYTKPKTKI